MKYIKGAVPPFKKNIVHIKGQSVMRLKVRKLISTKRTHRVNAI